MYSNSKDFVKHIGYCLEKIQVLISGMPRDIVFEENKVKAALLIKEVKQYHETLANIIQNPKFKHNLEKLQSQKIDSIRLQAHDVQTLFQDLEHTLYIIDLTLIELKEIIFIKSLTDSDILRWKKCYDKLVLLIDQKFGGEMGELRREFQISLHTTQELEEIVTCQKHLLEFLQ